MPEAGTWSARAGVEGAVMTVANPAPGTAALADRAGGHVASAIAGDARVRGHAVANYRRSLVLPASPPVLVFRRVSEIYGLVTRVEGRILLTSIAGVDLRLLYPDQKKNDDPFWALVPKAPFHPTP